MGFFKFPSKISSGSLERLASTRALTALYILTLGVILGLTLVASLIQIYRLQYDLLLLAIALLVIVTGIVIFKLTERIRTQISALREVYDRTERYQTTLLNLAKTDYPELSTALRSIAESDAQALGVERVSVWKYNGDRTEIVCENLYQKTSHHHERGLKLKATQYPRYFKALEDCRTLAAHDATRDPSTSEFTEGYLKPLGITSMLDVPIRLHGKVVGVICHEHIGPMRTWSLEEQDFAVSISEMVSIAMAAEERRRAEEALIESNKQLEKFARIVSHDLQEPLHTIIGFTHLIQERCLPTLNNQAKDYLERIRGSATRMHSLIKALLAFAIIDTRVKVFERVDLQKVVEDVLSDLQARVTESGGKIEFKNLPVIHGDRLQIQQLFQNLLSNGLKFRKKDEPPFITIEGREGAAGLAEIEFQDHGIGFDMQFKDLIFEPFQRLHGRSEFEGSGLGLSICQKIVERHGGQISVESRLGEGTTFRFSLPVFFA